MGSWMSSSKPKSTLFRKVQLVGYADGEYNVLVEDGVVKRVSNGDIAGRSEVIDCTDKWLAPVNTPSSSETGR